MLFLLNIQSLIYSLNNSAIIKLFGYIPFNNTSVLSLFIHNQSLSAVMEATYYYTSNECYLIARHELNRQVLSNISFDTKIYCLTSKHIYVIKRRIYFLNK